MPVFQSGKRNAPSWAEVEDFEIIHIPHGETQGFRRQAKKELFIIDDGMPVFRAGDLECKVPAAGYVNIGDPRLEEFSVYAWHHNVRMVRLFGHWTSIATAGTFELYNVPNPPIDGLPYGPQKRSKLDSHYHDYDEYWVFYEGRARVVDGGQFHDVSAGDCLVTPMGWHHDCLWVENDERIRAAWFAATPRGRKRIGHLNEARNGKAEPSIPLPT